MDNNIFTSSEIPGYVTPKQNISKKVFIGISVILALGIFGYFFLVSPPTKFESGTVFEIKKGMNLRDVSRELEKNQIIRSPLVFEALVIFYGGEKAIRQSAYLFEERLSVYEVANRMLRGEHRMPPVVATIPEGYNLSEIADLFVAKLANFDRGQFLTEAKDLEGFLFPDTYFFFTTDDHGVVIKSMQANYEKKMIPLQSGINDSGRTERDIIIMASLIEGEAKGDDDREVISGILWKRIKIGLALQVDVEPNTYKERGLPQKPIGNPGLASIKAALHPQESPYLYYLHGKDGQIYYAKDFEEHKRNIAKYLK